MTYNDTKLCSDQHGLQDDALRTIKTVTTSLQTDLLDTVKKHYATLRKDISVVTDKLNTGSRPSILTAEAWPVFNQQNIASLSGDISQVLAKNHLTAAEDRFLHSLYFTWIEERHQLIPSAHRSAFEWAFNGVSSAPAAHHTLRSWIRKSDAQQNIFWVSGKAGSGKSTLMRFLVDHDATRSMLKNLDRIATSVARQLFSLKVRYHYSTFATWHASVCTSSATVSVSFDDVYFRSMALTSVLSRCLGD